jgi:hypothetical protein
MVIRTSKMAHARWLRAVGAVYQAVASNPDIEAGVKKGLTELGDCLAGLGQDAKTTDSQRELARCQIALSNFSHARSPAYKRLGHMTLPALRVEAQRLIDLVGPNALTRFQRIHKRRKEMLLKWLDDNWMVIQPQLDAVDPADVVDPWDVSIGDWAP